MAEDSQKPRWRTPRILLPLLVYLAVTAGVVFYTNSRPDLYESIAMVRDSPPRSGEERVKLSTITAELVAEDAMLSAREGLSDDAIRTRIQKAALLRVDRKGRTTIRVRAESFPAARDIAKSVALHYRGSRAEARRRNAPLDALRPLRDSSEDLTDLNWLLLALQEQAHAAGFDSFGEVEPAAKDSAEARKLLADENFTRRYRKLRDLRLKLEASTPEATNLLLIGYPPLPRIPLKGAAASSTTYRSELAFTPPDPVPRRTTTIMVIGQAVALALAAILFVAFHHRSRTAPGQLPPRSSGSAE